jgi:hypothetical protein
LDKYLGDTLPRISYMDRRASAELDYQRFAAAAIVGGHRTISFYDRLQGDAVYLLLLRHPTARALSFFNYVIEHDTEQAVELREMGFDLNDTFDCITRSNLSSEVLNNVQCQYLSAQTEFSAARYALSKNQCIVATTEDLPALMSHLAQHYGFAQGQLPRVNTAVQAYGQLGLSSQELAFIESLNSADLELYEHVRSAGIIDTVSSALRTRMRQHIAAAGPM